MPTDEVYTPSLKVRPTLKSDPKQSPDGFGDYGHVGRYSNENLKKLCAAFRIKCL